LQAEPGSLKPLSMQVRFEDFMLDSAQRVLTRKGVPVELNARYFDALALLAGAPGELVTKDRFMGEVWRGVPVTDEALTQCIRTLRRQLGDDAASPRFIETVPKHGYRFIAALANDGAAPSEAPATTAAERPWRRFLLLGGMGTMGGGVAGLFGGLVYGFVATAQPGTGAASTLLVLLCLTIAVALAGAAGVSFGIAAGEFAPDRRWFWRVAGGALGGMIVGAVVKLLGTDAFNLLFGAAPAAITGGGEGALLGGATGLACWLALRGDPLRPVGPRAGVASAIGAGAGALIPLLGGRLMSGSLDSLARQFPASRLRLDPVGAMFGEAGFGPISQIVSSAMEGALFTGCIAAAMALALRSEGGR
jgi:DNA-binding winged helix-turn-helix (wHTH) protein